MELKGRRITYEQALLVSIFEKDRKLAMQQKKATADLRKNEKRTFELIYALYTQPLSITEQDAIVIIELMHDDEFRITQIIEMVQLSLFRQSLIHKYGK